jgi:hypothetical protein
VPDEPPPRPRFNAYLTADQIEWINRMRGRYMSETGKNLTATAFLRALVVQAQAAPWSDLRATLDEHVRTGSQPPR